MTTIRMALAHAQLAHVAQVRVRRVRPRPASDEGRPGTREANARARVEDEDDRWEWIMSPPPFSSRPEGSTRAVALDGHEISSLTLSTLERRLTNPFRAQFASRKRVCGAPVEASRCGSRVPRARAVAGAVMASGEKKSVLIVNTNGGGHANIGFWLAKTLAAAGHDVHR